MSNSAANYNLYRTIQWISNDVTKLNIFKSTMHWKSFEKNEESDSNQNNNNDDSQIQKNYGTENTENMQLNYGNENETNDSTNELGAGYPEQTNGVLTKTESGMSTVLNKTDEKVGKPVVKFSEKIGATFKKCCNLTWNPL